jgi:phospholipid/cholesterol/gamma-HCH transport system substrate-binding protein
MSAERGQLATLPRRALGLALLLVVAGFLVFTVAVYRQAFTSVVWVDLKAERAGSQLVQRADVKIHGVRVGEVRSVSASADGVTLRLAFDPDQTASVPKNVTARLTPKTLFGERYVELLAPSRPDVERIAEGDVIRADTSRRSVEVNQVWDDLMPILRSVRPHKLATTLTAVSTALDDGNGKKLGQTLVRLNTYLRELNPSLPDLTEDLRSVTTVADVYSEAAPDLVRGLEDLTVTSRTVLQQRRALESLLTSLTTTADDVTDFLAANGDNLVDLAKTSRPTLELLAAYAPEFPCLFRQLDVIRGRLNEVWGGPNGDHKLHLTIETAASRGRYRPGVDEPRYQDKRGPACYQLPASGVAPQYPPSGPIKDGSTHPPAGGPPLPLQNGPR